MRNAIIVMGMHRCGTSTISGILNHLGFSTGKNPQEIDFFNIKGYFENTRIGIFNNELLDFFHASWCDTAKIPGNFWLKYPLTDFKERLRTILLEEFDDEKPVLIKDPRISVLAPFYLEVFQNCGIRPHFIINFRNPAEVHASLRLRNNISLSRAATLWMDHLLKAEFFTRGYPRFFLCYDDIVADPVSTARSILDHFGFDIPFDSALETRISGFVDPGLRHNSSTNIMTRNLPGKMRKLGQLLLNNKSGAEQSSDRSRFDNIRKWFQEQHGLLPCGKETPEILLQTIADDKSRTTVFAGYHSRLHRYTYEFSPPAPARSFLFLPPNGLRKIEHISFSLSDAEQNETGIDNIRTNAVSGELPGPLFFKSILPEFYLNFNQEKKISRVIIEMTPGIKTKPGSTWKEGIACVNIRFRNFFRKDNS